ncbi:hypothetical protein XENOCAPTIV_004011, partial [Xenoophorus captivus]
ALTADTAGAAGSALYSRAPLAATRQGEPELRDRGDTLLMPADRSRTGSGGQVLIKPCLYFSLCLSRNTRRSVEWTDCNAS